MDGIFYVVFFIAVIYYLIKKSYLSERIIMFLQTSPM